MKLVFVAHGGGAAFQVAYVAAFVGDDEGPLELARVSGVDPEIGGKLYGAPDALGYVTEGTIAENRGVKGGVEVVCVRDYGSQVFLNQVGVILHGLREGAEDDAHFCEAFLMGSSYGHAVEDGVDGDTCEPLLFLQWDAELFVGLEDFGVYFVKGLGALLGGGVVDDVLVVDGRVVDVLPGGLLHGQPMSVSSEAPLEHEVGFALLLRDKADDVFVKARGDLVLVDLGNETVLVFLVGYGLDCGLVCHVYVPPRLGIRRAERRILHQKPGPAKKADAPVSRLVYGLEGL